MDLPNPVAANSRCPRETGNRRHAKLWPLLAVSCGSEALTVKEAGTRVKEGGKLAASSRSQQLNWAPG